MTPWCPGERENLAGVVDDVTLLECDVRGVDWEAYFSQNSTDVVFHFAANAYVPPSVESPSFDYETNFAATFRLLEALRRSQWPGRMVFACAPPHINTQVTRETAMRVCTTQEHIAGHGSAASTGSAIAHRVRPSWKHRRNEAVLTKERAKERARQTRCEGVAMFRLRTTLRSVAVITLTVVAGCLSGCAPFHAVAQPMFIGDYSTGDFSQWASVQHPGYNGPGVDYVPWSYSATVVDDPVKGKAARFEVRSGDWPGFAGGERSDVGSLPGQTGGTEGQMRWYEFSTMFDPSFPQNHADLGWAATNGWHPDTRTGSGGFEWSVGTKNGYWSLIVQQQTSPGVWVAQYTIFETPLNVGHWHDVKMQINWSTGIKTGWIRLWLNGVRQTFFDGSDTYFLSTLVPGTTTCYYKEGYYRQAMQPTGIVYHTGFRAAG